jgi:uncharacterized membrane protein YccC
LINPFNLTLDHVRAALYFDRYQFHFRNSFFLALGLTAPIAGGIYFQNLSFGICAAFGALFLGIFNPDEPYPILARSLLASLLCITAAAFLGQLVSSSYILIITSSIFVAAICGFAGVLGPHASLIGMLSLVVFCLFAGKYTIGAEIFEHVEAVFAGGLLQLSFALIGWPLRTFYPLRRQLANAYCALGDAAQKEPLRLLSPMLASSLFLVSNGIPLSGAAGKTAQWMLALTDQCEIMRINFITLANRREHEPNQENRKALDMYCQYLGAKVHTLGKSILLPGRPLKISQASTPVIPTSALNPKSYAEIITIEQSITRAHQLLDCTFPIGLHADVGKASSFVWNPLQTIKNNLTADKAFFLHGVRLAIALPIGWILGFHLLDQNQFWIPLTIAWITKPDYAGTVPRILARVIGTLLGAIFAGLVISALDPGPWLLLLLILGSAFAVYAYLLVNYAATVFFITGLVLFLVRLISMEGELPIVEERIGATLIAGALALIISNVKPVFVSKKITPSLLRLLEECKKYVELATSDPEHAILHIQAVRAARLDATNIIEAAKLEPNQESLSAHTAEKILMSLLEGMYMIASIQTNAFINKTKSEIDPYSPDIEMALGLLINKIQAISNKDFYPDDAAMKALETNSQNPILQCLGRAYSFL